jgi:uncharacterized membrane protein/thiol-disulfide isomerase/thioredoxin
MSRALLNKITLGFAILGCLIALVLTYEHFRPAADIGCGIVGGNCHSTIESQYGKLGPIPTSLLGLGMYMTIAGICVLRARSLAGRNGPGPDEKQLGMALLGISMLALCISWWLQFIALFVVQSFCPWCLASALTVTIIFAINAYDYLIIGRAMTGEQKMLAGVVGFICVMLAFVYGPGVYMQYRFVTRPQGPRLPEPDKINDPFVHPREELMTAELAYKGKPTALYTIIEFADYGCGHCREASEDIEKIMQQYPDRYRLAFRNFPLGRWTYSADEAAAAEAAGLQGKFWEMHDILFKHQPEVEAPGFGMAKVFEWAKSIGLDVPRLQKDMKSDLIQDRVKNDHITALKNRVRLTPSFFIIPSEPKARVTMVIGGADAKVVLADPKDPFWSGSPVSLKNPETGK